MRILQAGNFQIRRNGLVRILSDRKLYYGLVRNNHHVHEYSDRDMAAFLAPFRLRDLGKRASNKCFLETCRNFRPDLIILGHCDILTNRSLVEARRLVPNVRIAYRNVDALWMESNVERIERIGQCVDHIFLTTAGPRMQQFVSSSTSVSYVPNPVDPAIEVDNNATKSASELAVDLLFCGNGKETDPRIQTVRFLQKNLNCSFHTYGSAFGEAIWGSKYQHVLRQTRMGLNLSRQETGYLCSSSRISQLMGNGILTFIHRSTGLERFFGNQAAAFFSTNEELLETIEQFLEDDAGLRRIASAGREWSFAHFSSAAVAQFMVESTMNLPFSRDYVWADEAYASSSYSATS